MYKVGIIGPESTGKSTLAKYFSKRYNGLLISEYARTYLEELQRPYTYEDVLHIARHQVEELQQLCTASQDSEEVVFFDTELLITRVWLDYRFGSTPDWFLQAIRDYPMDVYLLTYPDIPWQADPTREHGDEETRLWLFHRYEQEVQQLNIPYYIIRHQTL